jgi:hypothetical protein
VTTSAIAFSPLEGILTGVPLVVSYLWISATYVNQFTAPWILNETIIDLLARHAPIEQERGVSKAALGAQESAGY